MTILRKLSLVFTSAIALLVTSCIDSREEFWLEADGSGRGEIHASLPLTALQLQGGEAAVRHMISEFLKNTPEISSSDFEINTIGNRAHIRVRCAFESALDLAEMAGGRGIDSLPSAASHLAGTVNVDFQGRTLHLERRVEPGKALPGSSFLPSSTWEGHQLLYTVHLPAAAYDHNATRVENDGRTLVWDIPLANALQTPVVTRFKMDVPVPWKLVSGIAVPVCVLAAILFLRFRRNARTDAPAG